MKVEIIFHWHIQCRSQQLDGISIGDSMICSDIWHKYQWYYQSYRVIFQNCYTQFHKLLGKWNLRQFWNITSGIYAKYHMQIMLLFVYTTIRKRFVIVTCGYFKLRWNTTALSQSNCRKFSCSSINFLVLPMRECRLEYYVLRWLRRLQQNETKQPDCIRRTFKTKATKKFQPISS